MLLQRKMCTTTHLPLRPSGKCCRQKVANMSGNIDSEAQEDQNGTRYTHHDHSVSSKSCLPTHMIQFDCARNPFDSVSRARSHGNTVRARFQALPDELTHDVLAICREPVWGHIVVKSVEVQIILEFQCQIHLAVNSTPSNDGDGSRLFGYTRREPVQAPFL
jgi:hypothetical protein